MKNEREFLDDVKYVLDESVDNLDGATRSALNRARYAALERHAVQSNRLERWFRIGLLPAVGLAIAAILLVVVMHNGDPSGQEDLVADLDVLSAEESTEFYEDLDFYLWVSEEADDENHTDVSGMYHSYVAFLDDGVAASARRAAHHGASRIFGHVRG